MAMTIDELHWAVIAFMSLGWIPGGRHWQYVRTCHALAWVVAMSHWTINGSCPLSQSDAVGAFIGLP